MIENFDTTPSEATPFVDNRLFNGYNPTLEHHKKHRPKGRKQLRRALEQTERERDRLLFQNGLLYSENAMMKRAIYLATKAQRRQLDDGLAEDTLRLLPPKREGRDR